MFLQEIQRSVKVVFFFKSIEMFNVGIRRVRKYLFDFLTVIYQKFLRYQQREGEGNVFYYRGDVLLG